MEQKAVCVQSLRALLQPYLTQLKNPCWKILVILNSWSEFQFSSVSELKTELTPNLIDNTLFPNVVCVFFMRPYRKRGLNWFIIEQPSQTFYSEFQNKKWFDTLLYPMECNRNRPRVILWAASYTGLEFKTIRNIVLKDRLSPKQDDY